ncbi:hypothetical protein EBR21_03685 [bacterium]|nr:hypothetical protein [bacterium]
MVSKKNRFGSTKLKIARRASAARSSALALALTTTQFTIACSSSSTMAARMYNPKPIVVQTNGLAINVADVPLSNESRIAGYLPLESRLSVLNINTGDEVFSISVPSSDEDLLAQPIRDGVLLGSSSSIKLFLFNGGESSASIKDSYAVNRMGNESQFVGSYEAKAEVINLLDGNAATRVLSLPHDTSLFPVSNTGARLNYSQTIHSFFASATNDVLVSLELLQLRFARFKSTGTDLTGATKFSTTQSQLCVSGDLNRIGEVNDSNLPVAYSQESSNAGVLVRSNNGRMIYLDFESACSGGNALRIFQPAESAAGSKNWTTPPLPVGRNLFAIHGKENQLDFFDTSNDPIAQVASIPGVCDQSILGHRKYDDKLLIVCGKNTENNSQMLKTISSIAIINTATFKLETAQQIADTSTLAAFALDNRLPKVFTLANNRLGRLTTYDFSGGSPKVESKANFVLKNILDKL